MIVPVESNLILPRLKPGVWIAEVGGITDTPPEANVIQSLSSWPGWVIRWVPERKSEPELEFYDFLQAWNDNPYTTGRFEVISGLVAWYDSTGEVIRIYRA